MKVFVKIWNCSEKTLTSKQFACTEARVPNTTTKSFGPKGMPSAKSITTETWELLPKNET